MARKLTELLFCQSQIPLDSDSLHLVSESVFLTTTPLFLSVARVYMQFCYPLLLSHSVVSNSLRSHGLQHARLPCRLLSPRVCPNLIHWVGDAIQPSHPLLPPFPAALSLPQHQGLFQWVNSLHQVAKVLELQLQHQSFQCLFRVDFL